jgi:para-nitrobenzyl esterase
MEVGMRRKYLPVFVLICMLLLSATLIISCGKQATQTKSLETPVLDSGPISGTLDGSIWTFKGIPYAAPPVGNLRWKEPQEVQPWKDVRACTNYGPACPQPASSDFGALTQVTNTSEDCLYLNVWTPATSPDQRLPVMFWIHGGSFTTGAGSLPLYDGHNLATRGIIVVTINYRLGPLGFMAHPELSKESPNGVSGNYGLLDQIFALQWVQRNIAAFGGDAKQVTVFGESAGGISINDLMVSPLANGLFAQAINESGPFVDLGLRLQTNDTLADAEAAGVDIANKLGCSQSGDVLACLRGKTPDELMQAGTPVNKILSPIPLGPNVDGYVLPETPSTLFAKGKQQAIPIINGTNANEGSIFAPDITPDMYRIAINYLYGSNADRVFALYPATTQAEVKPALTRLITEMGFAASSRFACTSMSRVNSPAYMYQFTRVANDPRIQALGAFHGVELIYVFGNLDLLQGFGTPQAADLNLSEAMMDYWTSFAKTGNPNSDFLQPQWPAFDASSNQYLELGDTITQKSNLDNEAYNLMLSINGISNP